MTCDTAAALALVVVDAVTVGLRGSPGDIGVGDKGELFRSSPCPSVGTPSSASSSIRIGVSDAIRRRWTGGDEIRLVTLLEKGEK